MGMAAGWSEDRGEGKLRSVPGTPPVFGSVESAENTGLGTRWCGCADSRGVGDGVLLTDWADGCHRQSSRRYCTKELITSQRENDGKNVHSRQFAVESWGKWTSRAGSFAESQGERKRGIPEADSSVESQSANETAICTGGAVPEAHI